jgi:hypothetical protein
MQPKVRQRQARPRRRRSSAALGACALAAVLSACGSSGGSASGASSAAPAREIDRTATDQATNATSTTPARTSAAAQPGGRAVVHVSGGMTIDAQGNGGGCAYYYPSERKGFAYSASSSSLPGGTSDAGGWSMQIFNDDGHHLGVLFNTDEGSWTSTRTITGTLHADSNLHHADFDVQITKVIGQQHAQLKGSIDCP